MNSSKITQIINIFVASTLILKAFSSTSKSSMSGTISVNILLSVFLGFSLNQLWLLMNTLQIMTNMPLLELSLPSNVIYLTQSLREISNMNLVPKEDLEKVTSFIQKPVSSLNSTGGNFQMMDIFEIYPHYLWYYHVP